MGQRKPLWIDHPDSWVVEEVTRVGPFVTRVVFQPESGPPVVWSSRRHRKGLGLTAAEGRAEVSGLRLPRVRHALTRPLNWWIGALFMIGSAVFALGSAPFYADLVEPSVVGTTYFIGSIFFTSAAYLQYHQAVGAERAVGLTAVGGRHRFLTLDPHRIDWWATGVQLVGTVFFNVTTFAALNDALSTKQEDVRVWAPDALGSICFLVASALALWEVGHAFLSWRPDVRTR